ncbi:hypothetical protein EUX98_g3661 [Antrodiella citrinella]|uniref:RTA1-domain-containing protein n=1 Tax=Antrodiella citrinella TaxID=2447956 RepID=A0A4S4MVZ9_9APHY|nr:hypothetical protein EUX98_g3661 [Antrodiella citrinella]
MGYRASSVSSMSRTALSVVTWTLVVLSFAPSALARGPSNPSVNPFTDPKDDNSNPLRYIASDTLTAIAFSLVMIVALTQSVLTWRIGGRYMLSMVIACYSTPFPPPLLPMLILSPPVTAFAVGLGIRFGLHVTPDSKGTYIAEYLFVVLSPCGFIAANYVLLGRISQWMGGHDHLWITPRRITVVFVTSDVVTFLVQAAGGATSSADDPETALTGSHIFLAGLALQLVSFVTFSILYVRFLFRMWKHEPEQWTRDSHLPWYRDWRSLAGAMVVSCIGILIRSVYRTIELSQGFLGKLATTEAFFYGLDTLPLFIAIIVYIPFWPSRYIPEVVRSKDAETEERESKSADTAVEEA